MTLQGIFSGTPRLVRAPLGRDSNRNTPHGQMSYILYKSQANNPPSSAARCCLLERFPAQHAAPGSTSRRAKCRLVHVCIVYVDAFGAAHDTV
jgi:hypothetical protein